MKVKYIRVSTFEQNEARQQNEGIFDLTIIDKISGATKLEERPEGRKLLKLIEENKVSELHVHSLDRLGRNLVDVLNVITYLTDKQICLISDKEGIKTLNSDKTINPIAKLLIGVLGTFAEFELARSKERQKEGIEKAKKEGKFLGRSAGTTESKEVIMNKANNRKIYKLLQLGRSVRDIANTCRTSTAQVYKIRKLNEVDELVKPSVAIVKPNIARLRNEEKLKKFMNNKATS